ncbi:hypothetical protein [Clostridium puniceum]|nr:hypothetical protein [Clostridium puniceum]
MNYSIICTSKKNSPAISVYDNQYGDRRIDVVEIIHVISSLVQ